MKSNSGFVHITKYGLNIIMSIQNIRHIMLTDMPDRSDRCQIEVLYFDGNSLSIRSEELSKNMNLCEKLMQELSDVLAYKKIDCKA